jgi:hypothetical protein
VEKEIRKFKVDKEVRKSRKTKSRIDGRSPITFYNPKKNSRRNE